jgi:hypothetical protein
MAKSEPVVETSEADASEQPIDVIDNAVEDVVEDVVEISEEDGEADPSGDFWEAFEDEEAESLTTVWVCDVSFNVPEQGVARDIFASTTKAKVVNRLFSIISSPDLKDPCEFDAAKFTTKQQAIRAFFDGVEERNLFVGLVPIF